MRSLSRAELTAALAARQMLLERQRMTPAEAIRRLTPLQGQHPPAPFISLASRLDGFSRAELEAAIDARDVVKTTIMRLTLHVAAADEYPAYAQLARQQHMRAWRKKYPDLDEEEVAAELGAWLREPRTNPEIREHVHANYDGVDPNPWSSLIFARTVLPLVQLPPSGHWRTRQGMRFVADPRPRPSLEDAATLVLRRYLDAFGPASLRDAAGWAGAAQRDFAGARERLGTVSYRDEQGVELLDLPERPLPPAGTKLPVRLLAHWDQPLLAYANRDRIIPPELLPLKLTLSGSPTVTVDGRVAASWRVEREGDDARLTVTPHTDLARAAVEEIRAEADRMVRFHEPEARRYGVAIGDGG